MEYKYSFDPPSDTPDAPNKLIARAEKGYRYLDHIDIFRFTQKKTTSVNTIRFRRETAGHPVDDPVAIASGVMQVILAHAAVEGLCGYKCAFWYKEGTEDPYKRMYTLRAEHLREYMDDYEDLEREEPSSNREDALELARGAMQVVSDTVSKGLDDAYRHNENLHDRLLDHSKSSTIAIDNMQKLVGTLTEQLRDAAIQKDRALESIHRTRAVEVEAEAAQERWQMIGGMLRPALMVLAGQIGAKFGVPAEALMTDDEKAAAQASIANATAEADDSASEADVDARKSEILERLKTHPVTCLLESLEPSITVDQWHAIYGIKPAATGAKLGGMLRTTLKIRDEKEAQAQVTSLTVYIAANAKLQGDLSKILDPDQQRIVQSLVTTSVSLA